MYSYVMYIYICVYIISKYTNSEVINLKYEKDKQKITVCLLNAHFVLEFNF